MSCPHCLAEKGDSFKNDGALWWPRGNSWINITWKSAQSDSFQTRCIFFRYFSDFFFSFNCFKKSVRTYLKHQKLQPPVFPKVCRFDLGIVLSAHPLLLCQFGWRLLMQTISRPSESIAGFMSCFGFVIGRWTFNAAWSGLCSAFSWPVSLSHLQENAATAWRCAHRLKNILPKSL